MKIAALLVLFTACAAAPADPGIDPRIPVAYRTVEHAGRTVSVVSVRASAIADALVAAGCADDDCAGAVEREVCGADGGWCAAAPHGGVLEVPSLDAWVAIWTPCLAAIDDGGEMHTLPDACAELEPGSR